MQNWTGGEKFQQKSAYTLAKHYAIFHESIKKFIIFNYKPVLSIEIILLA